MSWFGKLTLGSLGLFFGGPLGAVAGAALGHILIDKGSKFQNQLNYSGPNYSNRNAGFRQTNFKQTEQTQAAYFVSLFSILGKLSKADGVVSREEIRVVQDFINSLPMDEREKLFAKQVFNEAKNSNYSIDDFATQLYQATRHQPTVLQSFLNLLFQLAAADGTFHPAEEKALKRIKAIFQISDQEYEHIKAMHFKGTDKYYEILECTPNSTDQEIKANYKKLAKEYHPDTIISKGLPEEFTNFATVKFQEIQEAYENVKRERKLS